MPALATIPPLLLVALGGALGASLRYLVGQWTLANLGPEIPVGTWSVNILGGLAIGILAGWLARSDTETEPLRLLLGVGVLGGFTTFSAFSLEVFTMIQRGDLGLAAAYAVSSVAGSIIAVFAGVALARG